MAKLKKYPIYLADLENQKKCTWTLAILVLGASKCFYLSIFLKNDARQTIWKRLNFHLPVKLKLSLISQMNKILTFCLLYSKPMLPKDKVNWKLLLILLLHSLHQHPCYCGMKFCLLWFSLLIIIGNISPRKSKSTKYIRNNLYNITLNIWH